MSFCDSAKRYASAITLLSASIISITFSAWQFQIDAGDMKWHKKSWDDICTSFPINMLRRKKLFFLFFSISINYSFL